MPISARKGGFGYSVISGETNEAEMHIFSAKPFLGLLLSPHFPHFFYFRKTHGKLLRCSRATIRKFCIDFDWHNTYFQEEINLAMKLLQLPCSWVLHYCLPGSVAEGIVFLIVVMLNSVILL